LKSLIVYSSVTGNTKKVAEAIAEVMPNVTIVQVQDAPNYQDFDLIVIGYWVARGMPDSLVLDYFKTLKNAKIILFGTLGAYPDSEYAKNCIQKSEKLLIGDSTGNKVLGSFLCMGKVSPKLLEPQAQTLHKKTHIMTEERIKRLEEGKKHPDKQDLQNAQDFVSNILKNIDE